MLPVVLLNCARLAEPDVTPGIPVGAYAEQMVYATRTARNGMEAEMARSSSRAGEKRLVSVRFCRYG